MHATKHLGISMDYSNAHLIEFRLTANKISSIRTIGVLQEKEYRYHANYYKKLSEIILRYEGVILFGPTDAKIGLLYSIIDDNRFANVKVQIKYTKPMTENQKLDFVRTYFSTYPSNK